MTNELKCLLKEVILLMFEITKLIGALALIYFAILKF